MNVTLVNFLYNPDLRDGAALLARYETLTGWAEGLRDAGCRVTVVQRFHRDETVERNGVCVHLVRDDGPPHPRAGQTLPRLRQRVVASRPDVAHIHGLLFPAQTWALAVALPRGTALAAQHHAGPPWRGARGLGQRWGLRRVDGFLFTARAQAAPWLAAGVVRSPAQVYEVMEGSTWFAPRPRAEARARTGLVGEPLWLWVGRLDRNKDPLTVLDGFERALPHMPGARLAMAFGTTDLLPAVQARLAERPALRAAVTLLGCVSRDEMPWLLSSADGFVLGSHEEGSGYALAEALTCGAVPVVTDIPSFRKMTDGGRIGALWPPGDAEALARALVAVARQGFAAPSAAARRFFDDHLSFPAIGRRAAEIYGQVVEAKQGERG